MSLIFIFGSFVGMMAAAGDKPFEVEITHARQTASLGVAIIVAALALGVQAVTSGFSLDIASTSATKALRSQEMPILPMAQWACIIAGGLYLNCSRQTRTSIAIVTLLLIGLAFFTGARTLIFIVVVFALTARVRIGVGWTRKWVIILIVPVLFLLTAYRYFFRAASWFSGSFTDFLSARGGAIGVLFSSDEISFAEVYSYTLSSLHTDSITRLPFQSVLGLIMTPLPRSWLGNWKPLPAQADFNLAIAPGLTDWKGGVVVGPYFDLYFEYGIWGSLVVNLIYGLIFGVLAKMASQSTRAPYFYLGAVTASGFIYMRTDLQNLGQFVWPLGLVVLSWKIATLILTGRGRTNAKSIKS